MTWADAAVATAREASTVSSLRVLLIDDDPDEHVLMREWLDDAYGGRCRLESADQYGHGIEMLGTSHYDVCFVDYHLGAGTGLDLIREMQNRGCRVPLVLLTGSKNPAVDAETLAAGAADYLEKDGLNSRILERSIRYTVERHTAREHLRLQADIGRILSEATSSEQAHAPLLRAIGERLRARVVMKWRFDAERGLLRPVHGWMVPNDDGARAFAAASTARARSSDGALGRAFASNQPVWLEDAGRFAAFLRRDAAAHGGIRAGLVVPIPTGHKVGRGLLEVYWGHAACANERLTDIVASIGRQIGHFLERVDAQAALQTRDTELRAFFDRASDAILIADDDGRYVNANPAACTLFGLTREELIGRVISEFQPALDRGEFDATWEAFLRAGEMDGEFRLLRPDGGTRIVDFRATANFLPRRHMSLLRDVTEHRNLEHQLLQSQKMETIGQLAGGIAHDFNNLLTVIMGNTELIRDELQAVHACAPLVDDVLRAAKSAASLTGQLLAFSRKQVLQIATFSLDEAVNGMERMIARLIGENIEIVTGLAAAQEPVRADRAQIEQVLLNLVVNARDAMPRGGKLTIETGVVQVDQAHEHQYAHIQPGRYVLLAVSDTGCGMDQETVSRIFEPFFTTKERGRGTGLGLATVYGTVRQSGGYVSVDSKVNRGTTFKVYLPAASGEPVSRPDGGSAAVAGGSETILVVEDADPVRRLTAELLRRNGYAVLEAANTAEAIEIAEVSSGPIHLLLTDLIMPGRNGRELYDSLVRERPALKVIFCSGYTNEAIMHHGVLQPAMMFLQKPFTAAGLLRKVREALHA